jgi:ABC-2 type transport system permease protein
MKAQSFEWGKVWALMRRDMSNWSSYKLQVIIAVAGALVGFASWGFNASYRNVTVTLYSYQSTPVATVSYLSFIVTGILVSNVVLSLTGGVTSGLRPWMLESILMTGIRPSTFVLGTVAWSYILSVIFFFPQLLIGIFFFQVSLSVNLLSFALAILISGIIVFGISMASVGMRLVTKVTDPINWVLGISMSLLSGQTFPVQYLNTFFPGISYLSWALPYTWIFDIVRLSTLANASIFEPSVAVAFLVSLAYAAVLVPAGLFFFVWGLRKAKKQGTLGWF